MDRRVSWLRLSRRQAGSVPLSEVCSAPKGSRMLSSLSRPRAMSHTVAWVDALDAPVLPSRLPAKACKAMRRTSHTGVSEFLKRVISTSKEEVLSLNMKASRHNLPQQLVHSLPGFWQ